MLAVQVKAGVEDSWVSEEVWRMELYLSVGIMALGLLSLLAVTSLPSVASRVNWREFSFIQVLTETFLLAKLGKLFHSCCCPRFKAKLIL